MKEDEKKVSPEFKYHPELGSLFLSADRNMLSLVSRDFSLLPGMNTDKTGTQKLIFLTGERSKLCQRQISYFPKN